MRLPFGIGDRPNLWRAVERALREGDEFQRIQMAQVLEPAMPVIEATIQRAMAAADKEIDRARRRPDEMVRDHYAITKCLRIVWQELNRVVQHGEQLRQTQARRAAEYANTEEAGTT